MSKQLLLEEIENKYLTVREVCRIYNRTQRTVYNWIKGKKIPAHKDRLTGQWRIPVAEVEKLLREEPTEPENISSEAQTEASAVKVTV